MVWYSIKESKYQYNMDCGFLPKKVLLWFGQVLII